MSKRKKTRQQKIIAELKRKVQPQAAAQPQPILSTSPQYNIHVTAPHTPTHYSSSHTYTLPAHLIRHDLLKTCTITGGILFFEIVLFIIL